MKILLSWLRELAELPESVEVIVDAMNTLGLAVEVVANLGAPIPGVVTAKVLETERHPDAAKVHRVYVDPGTGERLHVWCGAFNMAPGDVIPLATLGTTMPDGRQILKRGILGIDSDGMLCSATELGLGDDHSGIMILPPDTPLGLPIMEAVGRSPDVLFDLDLTRNRPDCWGHLGVARDLAAHFDTPLAAPGAPLVATGPERSAPVEIVDARCGRFTSTVLSGVVVGPSAGWMAQRLAAAGMRSINNVVDVSNYVMLELNQPNHAYDLATLGGGGFRIRSATESEPMTTLDGVVRGCSPADLLICDSGDRPIGIAGVMGGLDTEITANTSTVALEVAWFDPITVAQTAARLGLRSEASARFERGVDPYGIDRSIARFVELLGETCPGLTVHAGAVDARSSGLPDEDRRVPVRIATVNKVLGTELDAAAVSALLDPIGYTSRPAAPGVLDVRLPTWRYDSTAEIDVVEEVARHYGYERIGKTVPKSTVHGRLSHVQSRRRLLRSVLLGLGFTEVMPNPFLAPGDLTAAGLDDAALRIANPPVADESVLRTSLRPGLLKSVAYNESHRSSGVRVFEIGHVYPPSGEQLPAEYEALGVVLAGAEAPEAVVIWREISAALRFGARLDQTAVPAGCTPVGRRRSRWGPGWRAWWARSTPMWPKRSAWPSASATWSSTSISCSDTTRRSPSRNR